MNTTEPGALFAIGPKFDWVYPQAERDAVARVARVLGRVESPEDLRAIDTERVEILFGGWGMFALTGEILEKLPNLRAVFYAAGSVRQLIGPEFWERNILLSTARAANGLSVTEYGIGAILLSLKGVWRFAAAMRSGELLDPWGRTARGTYQSVVGIVSVGTIARQLIQRLQSFDLRILAYDPYLPTEEAVKLGVDPVGLPEIFERSDVVSLHTPWLPETEGMIGEELLSKLKPGATFINTARGAVVDEPALCRVLKQRPDLWAVLDVTHPEPPALDSPLRTLPNVTLTPHIAGAIGPECRRLGAAMVEEAERYLSGEPLRWPVTREMAEIMA